MTAQDDHSSDDRGRTCIVIGHAALDHVYRIAEFPVQPIKIRALEHFDSGGGMAANAAAAIGRLGWPVELWSRIGGDDAGRNVCRMLSEAGVDTTFVRVLPSARTATAAVIVDGKGERLVVSERDHAMPLDADWIPLDRIENCGAVLSDLNWKEATLAAFSKARAHDVATIVDIDTGSGGIFEEIIRLTDFAIFSSVALDRFVPGATIAAKLASVVARGCRHAGVTLGSQGYVWTDRSGNLRQQAAFKVDVVDTTGAGDAFHGAFAWAIARGCEDEAAALIASAVAAMKCRRLGARLGLPSRGELEAFLAELAASRAGGAKAGGGT